MVSMAQYADKIFSNTNTYMYKSCSLTELHVYVYYLIPIMSTTKPTYKTSHVPVRALA